ncbi:MAG: hypothetical protein ACFFDI_03355 [Promethearchaeota archaeon]
MKKSILIIMGLISLNLIFVTPTNLTTYPLIGVSSHNKQITADFSMSLTIPEELPYGEKANITVEIHLKPSAQSANQISVTMELETGLNFETGETASHDLGEFVPDQRKETNYTVRASTERLEVPTVLVRIKLYQAGEQQYIETPDGIEPYYATLITVIYPAFEVDGPYEVKEMVIPRLRLILEEEATLTFNVSNIENIPIYNMTFTLEFDEPQNVEVKSMSATSLDVLESKSNYSLVIVLRCTAAYASLSRLYLNVEAEGLEPNQRVVKIETYDQFNQFKYDNPIAIVLWPVVVSALIGLLIYVGISIRRTYLERERIERELEEKYGKALYEADF